MPRVIPSILVDSPAVFHERLALCTGHTDVVHIDVCDGSFVPRTSWADPAILASWTEPRPRLELHLMVDRPDLVLESWSAVRDVARVIVHAEAATFDSARIVAACKQLNAELFIGWRLLTNPAPYAAIIAPMSPAGHLVMGIENIGFSGQRMHLPELATLMTQVRTAFPQSQRFIIDGGVHETNTEHLVALGADELVMASEIFSAADPVGTLERLNQNMMSLSSGGGVDG